MKIFFAKNAFNSVTTHLYSLPTNVVSSCVSEGGKSSTHYLCNTNRFDVLSKGPLSGISVGGGGGGGGGRVKHTCFFSEYIKTTR